MRGSAAPPGWKWLDQTGRRGAAFQHRERSQVFGRAAPKHERQSQLNNPRADRPRKAVLVLLPFTPSLRYPPNLIYLLNCRWTSSGCRIRAVKPRKTSFPAM